MLIDYVPTKEEADEARVFLDQCKGINYENVPDAEVGKAVEIISAYNRSLND